jgi:8-oxo-dGTP diphosphatase
MFCSACGARLSALPPVRCSRCATEHWANAKPCAGVLVVRHGALLLLHRAIEPWADRWDVPGGFCDAAEHPIDAARREAREELGLDVEITGFLGMWIDRYGEPEPGQPAVHTLNCYYHARIADEARLQVDPAEALGARWFTPDELPWEHLSFPDHTRAMLRAWLDEWTGATTRSTLPDRPAGNLPPTAR